MSPEQDLPDDRDVRSEPSLPPGSPLPSVEATRSVDASDVVGASGAAGDDAEFELDPALAPVPEQIGEYRIERLIGAGGMGRVYKAEHRRMARVVALKTLAPERLRDEAAVQRFYGEVRAAARLLHPNIVTAFDAGEAAGNHYLAMEFVEGETLSQLVAREGPLPVGEAVRIIRGAALGLASAHTFGIVHRDVKPGNIMVASDGTVKVLDLGLATIRSDPLRRPTQRGRLVGTFQYIAPEQLEDPDAADDRADIYALGATLFYLLAGRSPYQGDMMDQLRQHRDAPLPDLFTVRKDVDLRLDHVFQRMMAKRPQDRYGSLGEMLEDLDAWRGAGGTPAWLAGLGAAVHTGEAPTSAGDPSTATGNYTALGIDVGMLYTAAAIADPMGETEPLEAGGPGIPLFRMAVAAHEDRLRFGDDAMRFRIDAPQHLAHSLHLYIGQSKIDRRILDQQCPPEALLGLMLRHVRVSAWRRKGRPTIASITLPACYDQLHRRSILQAAQIAGFDSIRLIDRGLAAAHSQLDPKLAGSPVPAASDVQQWMVISLTGLATEVMVVRYAAGRLHTLSSAGSWLTGALTWQRRMIDAIAERCQQLHGVDPRERLRDAARLQQACERVMNELLLRDAVTLDLRCSGRQLEIPLSRAMMTAAGQGVVASLMEYMHDALLHSGQGPEMLSRILLVGSLTRFAPVRATIRETLGTTAEMVPVERRALAQGAAMAAAAELPGRAGEARPPQGAAAYDLGLLAYTSPSSPGQPPQPRPLPVIPRGTALPARTGRRLSRGKDNSQNTITIVESAGGVGRPWRSLGTQPIPVPEGQWSQEAMFEVDLDGLLTVRLRDSASGEIARLPQLPKPILSSEEVRFWAGWVEESAMIR